MSTPVAADPTYLPPRARRRRRATLYAGLDVGLAAALALGVVFLYPSPGAPSASCSPPNIHSFPEGEWYAITTCNPALTLANSSYVVYELPRLSDGEAVIGTFHSNLSIGAYLLNGTQLHSLQQNPHPTTPPPSWYWSSGTVTNDSFQENLPGSPAQFYVVLENLHPISASVRWVGVLWLYYEG